MKSKKKLIMIILIMFVVLLTSIIFIILSNNTDYSNEKSDYSNEKLLRFYGVIDGRKKEFKYSCITNECKANKIYLYNKDETILNQYYSLYDKEYYLYNPVKNEKIEVNIDLANGRISQIIYNDDKMYALIIEDRNYSPERDYLYLMEEDHLYLKDISKGNIRFMTYGDDIIDINSVILEKETGHFSIVDFKSGKELFNTMDFITHTKEDYISITLTPIKVDNNYYYDLYSETEKTAYILNDKFKKIITYEQIDGRFSQYSTGNNFSIYKNKIYVISDKNFSVYDLKGNLIKKSKTYGSVYAIDKNYFLVSLNNKIVIIDNNENIIFELDEIIECSYIEVENNIITVNSGCSLCSNLYKYDINRKQLSKTSDCEIYE